MACSTPIGAANVGGTSWRRFADGGGTTVGKPCKYEIPLPWRCLILASPLWLDLHLLCTHGVPIADMLAHSPPLPLTIYYDEDVHETTEEDEEGILLALGHSDRVHYICLYLPAPKLWKIIPTMDEEFPILERFYIQSLTEDDTNLVLPRTSQV